MIGERKLKVGSPKEVIATIGLATPSLSMYLALPRFFFLKVV